MVSWSIFPNFNQIYHQVYSEMDDSGVAEQLDTHVWMNTSGGAAEEEHTTGYKVIHIFMLPKMCIVLDEVGEKMSQKDDRSKEGQLFVCAQDMSTQRSVVSVNDAQLRMTL